MLLDLEAEIKLYAAMLDYLAEYDDWLEATNLLVVRDGIQEALDQCTALPDTQRDLLRRADDRLVALREYLLRFPEVSEERGAPPSFWWWRLDEGPRVREQALVSAEFAE